ncbi:MAG: hypothetical protein K6G07_04190 [Lachnospiraceae bacterium]|nr:hypothetical protein [Lachnospiraceae bacterium]
MIDRFLRSLVTKEWTIGKKKPFTIGFLDILLLVCATVFAGYIRFALRDVVAGDYKMFFEPWVATLREAGGGIKGLGAHFDYVDYTTPYLLILSFISICPLWNTLYLMKMVSIFFDLVAAIAVALIVYECTKDRNKAYMTYTIMLFLPTVVVNGALWAQCDIIFSSFVMLSILFLLKDKPNTSLIFYGIAFSFKLQTLFIAPLYLMLWVKKKIALKHFLWLPVVYFIAVIPSWIAGQNLWDLLTVYFFQANGEMDIYALSHKFPNIYQIIGTDSFLREYADAGVYFTLAVLMVLLYYMARKDFTFTKSLILRMGMFYVMVVVYFLPHMHERYGILADLLAVAIAMTDFKRYFYVPLVAVTCSFAGYQMYLRQDTVIPLWVYAIAYLLLMLKLGFDIYREITAEHAAKAAS